MFCYREYAKKYLNIKKPEIIVNESIHPAWMKAAYFLGYTVRMIKIDEISGLSSLSQYISKINSNTVVIPMSAISYPHGLVDDIKGMNDYLVKHKKNIWIATDCCLGGYFTSISTKLKDKRFDPVDFSLERVGTITVDPHKYGQSPKGVSLVLFRNMELKCCSLSLHKYWTAGFYGTTGVSGSRSANPVVGAWISMKLFGMKGVIDNYT